MTSLGANLTGRRQQVRAGNWSSNVKEVIFKISQRSVLGPTLFLLYLNDLLIV